MSNFSPLLKQTAIACGIKPRRVTAAHRLPEGFNPTEAELEEVAQALNAQLNKSASAQAAVYHTVVAFEKENDARKVLLALNFSAQPADRIKPIFFKRLKAYQDLGAREMSNDLLNRAEGKLTGDPKKFKDLSYRRLQYVLDFGPRHFESLFGPLEQSLDTLYSTCLNKDISHASDEVQIAARELNAHSDAPVESTKAYLTQFVGARHWASVTRAIDLLNSRVRKRPDNFAQDDVQKIKKLWAQLDAINTPLDVSGVERLIKQGRSVLILSVHGPFVWQNRIALARSGLNLKLITSTRQDSELLGAPNVEEFQSTTKALTLVHTIVKSVRRSAAAIAIWPDGTTGADYTVPAFKLGNNDVIIRPGAANIGYMSKADIFYLGGVWRDGRFTYELIEGPKWTDDCTPETYTGAVHSTLEKHMQSIRRGDPMNIGAFGIYWKTGVHLRWR